MATLTFKYPVKINGRVFQAGEAIDEQLVTEGARAVQEEIPETPTPSESPEGGEADGEEKSGDVELTGMTLEQLKQYAKDNGFDIKGCTTKTAIIEAIEKA